MTLTNTVLAASQLEAPSVRNLNPKIFCLSSVFILLYSYVASLSLCVFVCLLVPAPFFFPRPQHGLVCRPHLFSFNNHAQLFIISSSLNAVYQLLPALHFLLDRLSERCVVLEKGRPSYLKMFVGFFFSQEEFHHRLTHWWIILLLQTTTWCVHPGTTHDFWYSEKNNFNFQSCIWSQVRQQRLLVY